MKYIIRRKIYNTDRLLIPQVKEVAVSDRIKHLINSGEVLYIERLDVHYRVCDCYTFENFAEDCLELRIVIDILDNTDKEPLKQIYTLKESLGELLPTKRPENRGAKE